MKITVLTLFKQMYDGFLNTSIIKRIIDSKKAEVKLVDIRDYSCDKHRHVDDTPYGGGAGMLMKVDVAHAALKDNVDKNSYVILTSPSGKKLSQADLYRFSKMDNLVILCGHYEGIDARIEKYVDEKISIGDYVLTGGELPSMVLIDGVLRLLDEGISSESLKEESFNDGLLEYDQYTRPLEYDGETVPFVLTNGNFKEIKEFNLKSSLKNTLENRPDLLVNRKFSKEEEKLIKEMNKEEEYTMIDIEYLNELADEQLEENYKFRTYLKTHADPEVLDEQFKQLHDKYFAIYDCSKCRNCCKQFHAVLKEDEIEEKAKFLNTTVEDFKNKYLNKAEAKGQYETKNCPCDFFDGNDCILKECKPEDCKAYPFTNKPGRLFSLWGIMDNATICPVVYEIVEELKKMYSFR